MFSPGSLRYGIKKKGCTMEFMFRYLNFLFDADEGVQMVEGDPWKGIEERK